ncbi:hypothetical protein PISL3812_04897 [Talaromyces islandicus]|uniref:Transcription factor domain-containing protein n=1 Tax=Talaromyces islandicus TaxID=28573 RepID=A0A0U1LYF8_TALIS|nr:hypothetical protein PISL3812_04897 [Talaromyces islandicus]
MQTALNLLQDAQVVWDEDEKVTLSSPYVSSGDGLRHSWAKSSVRQEIDEIVLGIEKGEKPSQQSVIEGKDMEPPNFASWTDSDFPDTDLVQPSRPNEKVVEPPDTHGNASSASENVTDKPSVHIMVRPHDVFQQRPSIPNDAWLLLDTHNRYTNSWFPIVPKTEVVRIISLYQDDSTCTLPEMALMWAVFALSSNVHYRATSASELHLSRSYYNRALSLISFDNVMEYANFVPALVLLAMLDMSENKWETASMLVGNAVRAGLMTRQDDTPLRPPRHTLFILSTFVMDTLVASRMRFVPHLRSKDVRPLLEFNTQGPEEWEQWPGEQQPLRSLSIFKEYVKLLMILNDCIYESHLSSRGFTPKVSSDLETWLFGLPKHCNFGSTTASLSSEQQAPPIPPPVANLGVTFDVVLCYLQASAQSDLDYSNTRIHTQENPSRLRQLYLQTFKPCPWTGILELHSHASSIRSTAGSNDTWGDQRLSVTQNSTNIPVNTVGSQAIFGELDDPKTIEDLIDELSSTQGMAEYHSGSNQFMYDLGFYDTP